MILEDALIAAIAAEPDDEAPQLVLADWLQSVGDARGELILLDHRDRSTPGGLTEPEALERLLLLAAAYGFPHARDEPSVRLPFEGGGAYPVQHEVTYDGHHYYVHYRHHMLSVTIGDGAIASGLDHPEGYGPLELLDSGDWSAEEADVILSILSDAIREGTPLSALCFPYTAWPLPQFPGTPHRVYALPTDYAAARGIARDRYGLAARDYHRWHAIWSRLRDHGSRSG